MFRATMLGLIGSGTFFMMALAWAGPASATPGMVNAAGCHRGHCHNRGSLRMNSRGRYYVPGHFSRHGRKHRRHRWHR